MLLRRSIRLGLNGVVVVVLEEREVLGGAHGFVMVVEIVDCGYEGDESCEDDEAVALDHS